MRGMLLLLHVYVTKCAGRYDKWIRMHTTDRHVDLHACWIAASHAEDQCIDEIESQVSRFWLAKYDRYEPNSSSIELFSRAYVPARCRGVLNTYMVIGLILCKCVA